MIDIAQFNKANVLASIVKEDFFEFVKEFWDVVCAETPIWNWHIRYLCGVLQEIAFKVRKKEPLGYEFLIINIPPRSTKTLTVSVLFPAWVWTWWPSASFIGAAVEHNSAVDNARMQRTIIKNELYSEAFPNTQLISDQDSKGHFINIKKGRRLSVGVQGNITGKHADFILADDLLNPRGARSEQELNNTNIFILETLRNRKKDPNNCPIILIMQRLHENDPTGMLLKNFPNGCKHICIPAELTDYVSPPELKQYYINGLMNISSLPKEYLDTQRMAGDFYYAGQYLQNPVPLGGGMFKMERINIEETLPKEWTKQVRYWDKGGTKDGGCYTVGTKLGFNCDGKVWIIDVKRGQWDAAEREKIIKQTAQMDGKDVIIGIEQEGGSGGKESAENTARNLMGYKVRLDRPTGDKAARADPFATQVNAHNVNMLKAEWNDAYINELAYFPDSTYKDQVDASSGAFKILNQKELIVGVW